MILKQAFEETAHISGGREVPAFIKIPGLNSGPIAEYAATVDGATTEAVP